MVEDHLYFGYAAYNWSVGEIIWEVLDFEFSNETSTKKLLRLSKMFKAIMFFSMFTTFKKKRNSLTLAIKLCLLLFLQKPALKANIKKSIDKKTYFLNFSSNIMILHWFSNSQFDSQNLPNFPCANLQNILNNTSRKYYWTTSGSKNLVETKTLVDKSNLFAFATKVHTDQKKKEKKTFNTNNNNSKEIKDKTWNQNHNNNNETDCSIVQTFLCLQQKLKTRKKKPSAPIMKSKSKQQQQ